MAQTEFDYIVVGAGSAGCALAARLTETAGNNVCLIEAGPDSRDWRIRMPLAIDRLMTTTTFNWAYESAPEPGLGGRKIAHHRGKAMGGSSSINGMVYTRGNPQDFDEWANKHGCKGWSYGDVLPYLKKSETAPVPEERFSGKNGPYYRGTNGPLRVTIPDYKANPLNVAFLNAAESLGYPRLDDGNGPQHEGFGVAEHTISGGQRLSTAEAYLTPEVRRRPNLSIIPDMLVERIIFAGKRATGIAARKSGTEMRLTARREVVLCAGAVGSPQILLLSGVGPKEELARHGIPVVHELPGVGKNLQDHLDIQVKFGCRQPVSLLRHTKLLGQLKVGVSWFLWKTGPAASNQFEVYGYLRSAAGQHKPDLKFEFFPLAVSHETFKPYPREAFQIHCTAESSLARGQLTLQSANPAAKPVMLFNYLSDERDLEKFRTGVRLIRELVKAQPFAPFVDDELEPGADVTSDEALNAWIRRTATTAFHIAGTCRMGPSDNPEAVVGMDLAVHGLEGLRVADASIMPEVVTSNLNATAIMIGERAADFVMGNPQLAAEDVPYWKHPAWETAQR